MDDIRLNYLLSRYKPLKGIFKGVFVRNELKAALYPFCLVSKESDFGTKRIHWVSLYFDANRSCDYTYIFIRKSLFYLGLNFLNFSRN